jgi:hypothetical protein
MKKLFSIIAVLLISITACFLQGCFKDSCRNSYTIYRPVYKKLTEVRASMKSEAPQPLLRTGKIYVYDKYIFINEINKGIHIIDNTNPASPKNIGFINIPGNVDLAVKGNFLYADSFSDIVVFDISNPALVSPRTFMDNVLKDYGFYWGNSTNADSVSILVDYIAKDTTVDCETYQRWNACPNCTFIDSRGPFALNSAPQAGKGTGGSLARFSVVNSYLYAVTSSSLYSFSLSDPSQPQNVNIKTLGWNIETIYPFKDKLFIGSSSGMFIFDLSDPAVPAAYGQFNHARTCDPVVADDHYAFVTLRSGNSCQGFNNQLDVVDINNLSNPSLVKSYSMTNPYGLSKDGNILFICDGKDGLKVFNATDVNNVYLIKKFGSIEAYDVITINGLAIVIAKDGLYQYNYSDPGNIKFISHIISLNK